MTTCPSLTSAWLLSKSSAKDSSEPGLGVCVEADISSRRSPVRFRFVRLSRSSSLSTPVRPASSNLSSSARSARSNASAIAPRFFEKRAASSATRLRFMSRISHQSLGLERAMRMKSRSPGPASSSLFVSREPHRVRERDHVRQMRERGRDGVVLLGRLPNREGPETLPEFLNPVHHIRRPLRRRGPGCTARPRTGSARAAPKPTAWPPVMGWAPTHTLGVREVPARQLGHGRLHARQVGQERRLAQVGRQPAHHLAHGLERARRARPDPPRRRASASETRGIGPARSSAGVHPPHLAAATPRRAPPARPSRPSGRARPRATRPKTGLAQRPSSCARLARNRSFSSARPDRDPQVGLEAEAAERARDHAVAEQPLLQPRRRAAPTSTRRKFASVSAKREARAPAAPPRSGRCPRA